MQLTIRDSATAQHPYTVNVTWLQLLEHAFAAHDCHPDKLAAPLVYPTEFDWTNAPQNRPQAVYAKRVHLLGLDYDDVPDSVLQKVLQFLGSMRAVAYSTYKHADRRRQPNPLNRFRVFVALSRAVDVATEYDEFVRRVYDTLSKLGVAEGLDGPVLKDFARGFFVPCAAAPEDLPLHFIERFEGTPIDVDHLLAQPCNFHFPRNVRGVNNREGQRDVSREMLSRIAKGWRRSVNPWNQVLGDALDAVIAGEEFAAPGTIDNTIFDLADGLAKKLPWGKPTSIAEHFAPSLQLMAKNHPAYAMTTEQVEQKLERRQDHHHEEEQVQVEAEADQARLRIRAAWKLAGKSRDTGYSEEELNAFASTAGCTPTEFKHRWVIKHENSMYYWLDGAYQGPHGRVGGEPEAAMYLAPASTVGVRTHDVLPTGQVVQRSVNKLVDLYGTAARRGVVCMVSDRAHYDGDTGEMVEAPFQVVPRPATYNAACDLWLQALGHGKFHLLEAWIAWLPRLDHPCAAVYFSGAAGVGKSYFAKLASSTWNERGPTAIERVFQDKNESVLNNPVIFADETFPEDARGNPRTGELREWIQRRTTPLRRMYRAPQELRGSFRFVIAANNQSLLLNANGNRELTNDDIAAISERILMLTCQPAAAALVTQFTEEQALGHFKWIQKVRAEKLKPEGRFMIRDPDSTTYKALSTRGGVRYQVCEFLVAYLMRPQPVDARQDKLLFVAAGSLWVKVQAFGEYWESLLPHAKRPATAKISATIKDLSCGTRKFFGKTYRQVDGAHLMAWAHDQDILERTEFAALIQRDTRHDGAAVIHHPTSISS